MKFYSLDLIYATRGYSLWATDSSKSFGKTFSRIFFGENTYYYYLYSVYIFIIFCNKFCFLLFSTLAFINVSYCILIKSIVLNILTSWKLLMLKHLELLLLLLVYSDSCILYLIFFYFIYYLYELRIYTRYSLKNWCRK